MKPESRPKPKNTTRQLCNEHTQGERNRSCLLASGSIMGASYHTENVIHVIIFVFVLGANSKPDVTTVAL